MSMDESTNFFLMSGVEKLTFSFYDGSVWQTTWDSTVADTVMGVTT